VRPDADADGIKKAFRKAAKAYHPDLRGGDPEAASRFRRIVEARAVLCDPDQRAAYDFALRFARRRRRREWALAAIRIVIAAAVGGVGGSLFFFASPATTVPAGKNLATRGMLPTDKVEERAAPVLAVREVPAEEPEVPTAPGNDRNVVPIVGGLINAGAVITTAASGPMAVREQATQHETPVGATSGDARLHREQAVVACRNGGLEQAVAAFDQVIALESGDAQAYHIRGNLRDDIGDRDGALADYDQAIRLNPSSSVYHDRGILWQRMGAFDKAIVDFDRAVRFTFSEPGIYIDRGFVWFQKGRHDRAAADFDRAVKIDAEFAEFYIGRGVMMHSNGTCKRAAGQVDRATRIGLNILTPDLRAKFSR
jgi:tetratricopeptide (TPR) repeat protein